MAEKLWDKVEKQPNGCWLWTGHKTEAGYGIVRHESKNIAAHRVAYLLTLGPVPAGRQLDHLCRVHACVNPEHVDPVTATVNMKRSWTARLLNRSKRTCACCGALLVDPNLMFTRDNEVVCRACDTKIIDIRPIRQSDEPMPRLVRYPWGDYYPVGTDDGRKRIEAGAYRAWCFGYEFFIVRMPEGWMWVEIDEEVPDCLWRDVLNHCCKDAYPNLKSVMQGIYRNSYFWLTGQIVCAA